MMSPKHKHDDDRINKKEKKITRKRTKKTINPVSILRKNLCPEN